MHPPQHYANLRRPYEPDRPRLILIAESPPKSGKYFYDPTGKPTEPLFSAQMESLLAIRKPATKAEGLQAFKDAGFLLLDATYTPLALSTTRRTRLPVHFSPPKRFLHLTASVSKIGQLRGVPK